MTALHNAQDTQPHRVKVHNSKPLTKRRTLQHYGLINSVERFISDSPVAWNTQSDKQPLVVSSLQHSQCSVGVVSLAVFEQPVAIFDFSDEHVDDKYSDDLCSKHIRELEMHDWRTEHVTSVLLYMLVLSVTTELGVAN